MQVATAAGYNGTFTIASVIDPSTFTFNDTRSGLETTFSGTAASASTSQQAAQGIAVFCIVGDYEDTRGQRSKPRFPGTSW